MNENTLDFSEDGRTLDTGKQLGVLFHNTYYIPHTRVIVAIIVPVVNDIGSAVYHEAYQGRH